MVHLLAPWNCSLWLHATVADFRSFCNATSPSLNEFSSTSARNVHSTLQQSTLKNGPCFRTRYVSSRPVVIFRLLTMYMLCFSYIVCVVRWHSGKVLDMRSIDEQNPICPSLECNPGKVVSTRVPLLPSSVIWCQPMGGDTLRLGR